MRKIPAYLIYVYIIDSKKEDLITAIRSVCELKYGSYKNVHWISPPGREYYTMTQDSDPGNEVNTKKLWSNDTVKIEFSIPKDQELLDKLIKKIYEVHPWKQPVLRIQEVLNSVG